MRLLRERGQSAVEFALVAPIFFALLFGVIAAGWLFFQSSAVNDAAQGAAREAIVVSYSGQRLSLSGGCAAGTPVPVQQAAQHAANILPVDPNPLCKAANNSFCTSGNTLLTQMAAGQDATIELCVVGGVSSPSAYTVKVTYIAHPLEPLLGTSVTLTSTSSLAAGAA
ncbi:MAG: TadE/TadG family type IV pilus assembly protein [Candidatus Dormibacteria bacterium]